MPHEEHLKNSDDQAGEELGGPWPEHGVWGRQSWGGRPGLLALTPSACPWCLLSHLVCAPLGQKPRLACHS